MDYFFYNSLKKNQHLKKKIYLFNISFYYFSIFNKFFNIRGLKLMFLITGGAGFIGSNIVNYLVDKGEEVVSVDWHNKINNKYFHNLNFKIVDPLSLHSFLKTNKKRISVVIHLGAITSTTERNLNLIVDNNIRLSLMLYKWCIKQEKRLIYASSAATYGNGENGFNDISDDEYLSQLIPLNLYGWSKHVIDRFIWNESKKNRPPQCVGLKFFNVYGPNEFHKKDMKSIILKFSKNSK